MNHSEIEDFTRQTVRLFLKLSHADPRAFRSYFCGAIIGNVAGNMKEEDWKVFIEIKPCGHVGCDCHLHFIEFIKQLALLREDHQTHCPRSISE